MNRPDARNAMSRKMVEELERIFGEAAEDEGTRFIVLSGAGGHFCAGGDIADMAAARAAKDQGQAFYDMNRAFGRLIAAVNRSPKTVIACLEGAVLGGGFGLACATDIALVTADAKLGMPETTLGLPPAQIVPFVVERIGLTEARRLALTGEKFDGREAVRLGIAHYLCDDADALAQRTDEVLAQARRCAPKACGTTKHLLLAARHTAQEALLDGAAKAFAEAVQSDEAVEGTTAFIQKRAPSWADDNQ